MKTLNTCPNQRKPYPGKNISQNTLMCYVLLNTIFNFTISTKFAALNKFIHCVNLILSILNKAKSVKI